MTKKIAVYGIYRRIERPHRERRLVTRKDKIKQHYWFGFQKARLSNKPEKGRFEIHGNNNKELYKAVVNAHQIMPEGYVSVSAEKFNANPEKYGVQGEWVKREVKYETDRIW